MEKYINFGDEGETLKSDLQLNVDNFDQFWLPSDLNASNKNTTTNAPQVNNSNHNRTEDLDYLINETLTGLQDLDVPSGFAMANNGGFPAASYSQHTRHKSKTHSRQMSGTAIFGFIDHTRDWSIGGTLQPNDFYKPNHQLFGKSIDWRNINPNDLLNAGTLDNSAQNQERESAVKESNQAKSQKVNKPVKKDTPSQDILNLNFEKEPTFLVDKYGNDEGEENNFTANRLAQSSPIKQISTPTSSQPHSQNHNQISVTQPQTVKQNDYVVTNQSPKSYKFPPPAAPRFKNSKPQEEMSPSPLQSRSNRYEYREGETNRIVNSYSAKYLQSLQFTQQQQQQQSKNSLMSDAILQPKLPFEYVDDFEPLLGEANLLKNTDEEQMASEMQYVPLPVQEPGYLARATGKDAPSFQQKQEQLASPAMTQATMSSKPQSSCSTEPLVEPQGGSNEFANNFLFNTFLPPPSPPTLSNSHDSPNWQSSPEPQSPSPGRTPGSFLHKQQQQQQQDVSPLHPSLKGSNVNFYTPMYYNRDQQQQQQLSDAFQSSPLHHIQEEDDDGETQQKSTLDKIEFRQQHLHQLTQRYNPSSQFLVSKGSSRQHATNSSPYKAISNNKSANYLNSSPFSTINSSPIRYYTSPDKLTTKIIPSQSPSVVPQQDTASPDPNATITQITPLRNTTYLSTPVKSNTHNLLHQLQNSTQHTQHQHQQPPPPPHLEWSPLISPNSKIPLKKQLKDTSPRNRIKKTTLLPPGEIDNYWVGPNKDKNFICTYKNCGKVFTRRYNVRSHVQTHLSDRPFGCEFCGKRFVRQHDLNRHLKGHGQSKMYKCPCGKDFTREDAMKKHQERNICVGGVNGMVNKPSVKRRVGGNGGHIDVADLSDDRVSRRLFADIINEKNMARK
ncbi:SWI5 [Candida theae]|uniref:SWI5 n=1 Tax=Candida theae TaxID=1198502 RepID=A0AAD5FYZ1_9ASCO|nr:SWI5 [Candida theae]KAI5958852.1 SWI5 [Candida theae]